MEKEMWCVAKNGYKSFLSLSSVTLQFLQLRGTVSLYPWIQAWVTENGIQEDLENTCALEPVYSCWRIKGPMQKWGAPADRLLTVRHVHEAIRNFDLNQMATSLSH